MEKNNEKIKASTLSEKTGRSMSSIKKYVKKAVETTNKAKKAALTVGAFMIAANVADGKLEARSAQGQDQNKDEPKKEIKTDAMVRAGDEKPTPEKPNVFEIADDKAPEEHTLPEGIEVEEIEVEEVDVTEEITYEQLAQEFREGAKDLAESSNDLEEDMSYQYESYIADYELYKQKDAEGADSKILEDYRHDLVESISGIEMNKIMKNTIESGKHTAAMGEIFSSAMAEREAGTSDSKSDKQSQKELKKIAKDSERTTNELLPNNQESIKKISTLGKESQKDINSDKITEYINETYKEAKNAVKKDRNKDNQKSENISTMLMTKNAKNR